MPGVRVLEPEVDPQMADYLVTWACSHLGEEPETVRVGCTDIGGAGNFSYTALAVGPRLLAVAEARQRGGDWAGTSVQVLARASVLQVVAGPGEAWLVVGGPEIEVRQSGLVIESLVLSVPATTLAHEVLAR